MNTTRTPALEDFDELHPFAPRPLPRPDRDRHRRKKGNFWNGIDTIGNGIALMDEWERRFGDAIDLIKPFLRTTGEAREFIACPATHDCGCAHYVTENKRGELEATCQCDRDGCQTYVLEPADILAHGLDWHLFSSEIRKALGLSEPFNAPHIRPSLREIGVLTMGAAPVYLSLAHRGELLRELIHLQSQREGPFLVLTPTGSTWTLEIEAVARSQGGGHISLSSALAPYGRGFKKLASAEPMLAEFARRVASTRAGGKVLQSIHREINAIRVEHNELRTAKQRLEKMLAEGTFAFTRKVDATSFKILCAILAEGDAAKAGRKLGFSDQKMRRALRDWRERGGAYATMLDLVRWRKRVGHKEELPLNDDVLHERADTTDFPGLLADVLDGLLSMTDTNWQDHAAELAELIRPAVRAG